MLHAPTAVIFRFYSNCLNESHSEDNQSRLYEVPGQESTEITQIAVEEDHFQEVCFIFRKFSCSFCNYFRYVNVALIFESNCELSEMLIFNPSKRTKF